jgi:hypothetical protein
LENHWSTTAEGESREYVRHACIQSREPYRRDVRSCDFPRHSGFYVFDLAFAQVRSGRADFLEQLQRFADYWWRQRSPEGLCLLESRTPDDPVQAAKFRVYSPAQTLSLAVSLLESAELLEATQPTLAGELRQRAAVYIDGFCSAPHDLKRGVFLLNLREQGHAGMAAWGSRYGEWPLAYVALFCLRGYRLTGDARLRDWSLAAGAVYCREAFPDGVAVPAMDAGLALGLLADLYDLTEDARWHDAGFALAATLMDRYLDAVLPRGSAGIDWYESQMGPAFLLHGLARLALLAEDRAHCPLPADYSAR